MTANTGGIKQFRQQTEGYEFTDAGRARVLDNGKPLMTPYFKSLGW
jgi:hypothetical protein